MLLTEACKTLAHEAYILAAENSSTSCEEACTTLEDEGPREQRPAVSAEALA